LSLVKTVHEKTIYHVFIGYAAILLAFGVFFSPSVKALVDGYVYILAHPGLIDFDGLAHPGHYGTAFFNAGLTVLCALLVIKLTNTKIQGAHIAAVLQISGFAFFGKDIVNIWFPIIGVYGYTAWQRKPLSDITATALFSTALAPVFSVTAFGTNQLAGLSAILSGAFLGILAGVIIAVLAGYLTSLHKGYTLFNTGFAAGLAGIMINALRSSVNMTHERFYDPVKHYVSGANIPLGAILALLFLYLIIAGCALGGLKEYKNMFWFKSKGGNYVEKFGCAPCLINAGVLGFLATGYVFMADTLMKADINGCLYACILTAAGFAANGVTAGTYLPLMTGVFLTASVTGGIGGVIIGQSFLHSALTKVGTRGMLLTAIYSCGMAPIPGEHGYKAGILAGMTHAILVPMTGAFHGFMSLYNNGLSLSLVATFLHPIYSKMGVKE